MPARKPPDPLIAFRFRFYLEINGVVVAGFSEITGLTSTTDIRTVREGGVNFTEYKLPAGTSFSNVVLKRGYVNATLFDWHQEIVAGKITRKPCSVFLQNTTGETVAGWNFARTYPVQWDGPSLSASHDMLAFESVELAHEGISKAAGGGVT